MEAPNWICISFSLYVSVCLLAEALSHLTSRLSSQEDAFVKVLILTERIKNIIYWIRLCFVITPPSSRTMWTGTWTLISTFSYSSLVVPDSTNCPVFKNVSFYSSLTQYSSNPWLKAMNICGIGNRNQITSLCFVSFITKYLLGVSATKSDRQTVKKGCMMSW